MNLCLEHLLQTQTTKIKKLDAKHTLCEDRVPFLQDVSFIVLRNKMLTMRLENACLFIPVGHKGQEQQ